MHSASNGEDVGAGAGCLDTGFALSRVLEEHAPAAGRVVTVDWVEVQAA